MVVQESSTNPIFGHFRFRRTGTDLRNNTVVRFVVDILTSGRYYRIGRRHSFGHRYTLEKHFQINSLGLHVHVHVSASKMPIINIFKTFK